MKTVEEITKALAEPFPSADIEWRIGRKSNDKKKAAVLAYVTNRAIQNRLDSVVGIDSWRNEYIPWRTKGVICGIGIKFDDGWLTKWDGADETDIEATKGGMSDSMKRAAVQWGIGRYLYNLEEVWVPLKDDYVHFDPPKLPDWALPENERKQPAKTTTQPQQPTKPIGTPLQPNLVDQANAVFPPGTVVDVDAQKKPYVKLGDKHPNWSKGASARCGAIHAALQPLKWTDEQIWAWACEVVGVPGPLNEFFDLGKDPKLYEKVHMAAIERAKQG